MIIYDYHNKKYIEIKDNKVIFYRFLHKRTLDLNKIRAAYIDDNYMIKILYGKSIRVYQVANIRKEDKVLLKQFIEKINKENVIFSSNNLLNIPVWISLFYIIICIKNLISGKSTYNYLFWMLMFVIFLFLGLIYPWFSPIFIYDYKNNVIKIEKKYRSATTCLTEDSKYKIKYKPIDNCYILKTNNMFKLNIYTNILYPINYKEKINNLYELSEK